MATFGIYVRFSECNRYIKVGSGIGIYSFEEEYCHWERLELFSFAGFPTEMKIDRY